MTIGGESWPVVAKLGPLEDEVDRGRFVFVRVIRLLTACANHSCAPNVCVTRGEGGSLRLFTTCSVPRGAELHISYVDTALPRAERQRLLAHWTMTCACERCVDEEATEGAAVPEDRGSGVKRQRT